MALFEKKDLSVERNDGTGKGSFVNGGVKLEPWSGLRRMGWICWWRRGADGGGLVCGLGLGCVTDGAFLAVLYAVCVESGGGH